MKNIVILISGGGSNMAAIVKAAQQEHWERRLGARVAAVVSNKMDAGGLRFAREQGIATEVLDHRPFPSREAFDAELAQVIDRHAPALVVLAGFMRVLTPGFGSASRRAFSFSFNRLTMCPASLHPDTGVDPRGYQGRAWGRGRKIGKRWNRAGKEFPSEKSMVLRMQL